MTLSQEIFTSKWWLSFKVETWKFTKQTFKTYEFNEGSDNGYAWPDAIWIKGSVCPANGVGLVA